MPLTQARMIAVLEAADEIARIHTDAKVAVQAMRTGFLSSDGLVGIALQKHGPLEPRTRELVDALIKGYEDIADAILRMHPPIEYLLVLEREKTHFKYNAKRNDLSRDAMARVRHKKFLDENPNADLGSYKTVPGPSARFAVADEEMYPDYELENMGLRPKTPSPSVATEVPLSALLPEHNAGPSKPDEPQEPSEPDEGRAQYEHERAERRARDAENLVKSPFARRNGGE